jgi:hypothetical protein
VTLFGAKPRALATSADGRHVYAAVFLSGNRTASVSGEDAVRLGRARQVYFDQVPYAALPKQGPIVKRTERGWRDSDDREWSAAVAFDFRITTCRRRCRSGQPKVIQTLAMSAPCCSSLAVQPSAAIWVSNTEAVNHIRTSHGSTALRAESHHALIPADEANGCRTVAIDLIPISCSAQRARELRLAQPLIWFSTRRRGSAMSRFRIAQGQRLDGGGSSSIVSV